MSEVENVELVGISVKEAASLVTAIGYANENGAQKLPLGPHLSRIMSALKDAHGLEKMDQALNAMKEEEKDSFLCAADIELHDMNLSDADRKKAAERIEKEPNTKMIGIVQPEHNWHMVGAALTYFILVANDRKDELHLVTDDEKGLAKCMAEFCQNIKRAIDASEKKHADSDKNAKPKKAKKKN